ncbi:site-specific recombinase [Salmonella enterica subsp. enterica serovar Typhi]|nr:site-specific recombinase [Salmonella enterica subsp. enterica serovar Typhi]
MLIGYVRVSTNDQNTDLQRNALSCAGCERIFEDKISGTKSDRPGLKKLLRTLSAGDTLVVWKLDRLGRSMRHLVTLIEELRQRGVNFRSLTDSIDTSTPMGRFFFHVMGALAEMERELIVERTRALHKFGGNSVVNFDSIIGPFAGFLISDFKLHREKRIFIGAENIFLHFYRPIEI